jgi:hypothetical protein
MLFPNIATGVILVLLGMRYVRKGLDRLFDSQLVDWLQQMTNNRYKAFFGGMVAGGDRTLFERDRHALSSDAEPNSSDCGANAGGSAGSKCWNNSLGSAAGVSTAGLRRRFSSHRRNWLLILEAKQYFVVPARCYWESD